MEKEERRRRAGAASRGRGGGGGSQFVFSEDVYLSYEAFGEKILKHCIVSCLSDASTDLVQVLPFAERLMKPDVINKVSARLGLRFRAFNPVVELKPGAEKNGEFHERNGLCFTGEVIEIPGETRLTDTGNVIVLDDELGAENGQVEVRKRKSRFGKMEEMLIIESEEVASQSKAFFSLFTALYLDSGSLESVESFVRQLYHTKLSQALSCMTTEKPEENLVKGYEVIQMLEAKIEKINITAGFTRYQLEFFEYMLDDFQAGDGTAMDELEVEAIQMLERDGYNYFCNCILNGTPQSAGRGKTLLGARRLAAEQLLARLVHDVELKPERLQKRKMASECDTEPHTKKLSLSNTSEEPALVSYDREHKVPSVVESKNEADRVERTISKFTLKELPKDQFARMYGLNVFAALNTWCQLQEIQPEFDYEAINNGLTMQWCCIFQYKDTVLAKEIRGSKKEAKKAVAVAIMKQILPNKER